MKRKIFVIAVLILAIIAGDLVKSYAAQAQACASVFIIIPPREQKAEENNVEQKGENTNFAQNQVNESKEARD